MSPERTEGRYSVSRSVTFQKLVDFDTLKQAGFDPYGQSSMHIDNKGGGFATVYLGHVANGDDVNIVIVEDRRKREDRKHTTRWYLRTFSGSVLAQMNADEKADAFDKEARRTLSRQYRIAGGLLETRIRDIIDEVTSHVLSVPLPY